MQGETNPLPWQFFAMQRARDGKWCVFVSHNDSPEWFRLIAEFASKDRAESYADIENDIANDGDETHFKDIAPAPKDLPTAPRSNVTPERLTVRTSVERREIEVTREPIVPTIEAPSLKEIEPPRKGSAALPEGEHGKRRGAILQAIKDHIADHDQFPSFIQIAERSGVSQGSLTTYLAQIEQQGELARTEGGDRYLRSRPDCVAAPPNGRKPASSRVEAVRAALIEFYEADGEFPLWGDLADKSGVPKGSIGYCLEQLEDSGFIVRDPEGNRRVIAAQKPAPAPASPPRQSGTVVPHKTDADLIAEHIAAKGVTKLPPAAAAETTAGLKSQFTHVIEPKAGRPTQAAKAASAIAGYQRSRA